MKLTGLILAGGRGQRMGGIDKGLQPFCGRPMVQAVLERLRPQVDTVLVNANQNLERYAALGYPVLADLIDGHAGPLAGLQAGLAWCAAAGAGATLRAVAPDALLTVPCDSPRLPTDLARRLAAPLADRAIDLSVAVAQGREQPVFALVRTGLAAHLQAFLEGGGRRIDAWYGTLRVARVSFDDEADAFANVNTLAELALLERDASGDRRAPT